MATFNENCWVIIPSAGTGQRFNHSLPKQYLDINGRTVLEWSIRLFLDKPWVSKILLPIAKEDHFFANLEIAHHEKIVPVWGGQTRMQSVANALTHLASLVQNHDWVIVHDAARPCLHPSDLNQFIENLIEDEVGGILASKMKDTIKQVFNNIINKTVPRDYLWQALTPQMFRYDVLVEAFSYCQALNLIVTDEASAVEQLGKAVRIVEAKYPNPKLTQPQDISFIKLLINQNTLVEESECV